VRWGMAALGWGEPSLRCWLGRGDKDGSMADAGRLRPVEPAAASLPAPCAGEACWEDAPTCGACIPCGLRGLDGEVGGVGLMVYACLKPIWIN
jgi:hypothetical protein